MDPFSLMVMGGGALLGGGLGLAGGLIQGDAAQNAAGAQLGYLDLARQQAQMTQQQQLAMLSPYQMYGSNALSMLQNRVMNATERKISDAKQLSQLKANVAKYAQQTDWASFPNLTGPKASERKAAMWQDMEFQRKQNLANAQRELASFQQEQKQLGGLYNELNAQLDEKQSRVDSALGRIADINPINIPTSLSQLRSDMANDPVYQFRQEAGERAINRAAAARGQYFSGAAMGQLSDFNLQLSGEETDKYFNRVMASEQARFGSELSAAQSSLNAELGVQQQGYNQLAGIAGMGLQATQTGVNAMGTNAALNASIAAQQGQAAAAGIQGKAAGTAQGLNSFAGAIGAGTSMFALSQFMQPRTPVAAGPDPGAGVSYGLPAPNAYMSYNPR